MQAEREMLRSFILGGSLNLFNAKPKEFPTTFIKVLKES